MKICITGYGPFRDVKINPSWEAVKSLPDEIEEAKLHKQFLEVSYEYATKKIPEMLAQHTPDLIIHCGVGQKDCIKIEQTAYKNGYKSLDICDKTPIGECIPGDCDDVLVTSVDTKAICIGMNEKGWKIKLSDDAGRYLCEYALGTSLSITKSGKVIFIHLPPVGFPYSQEELDKALSDLVKLAIKMK
jgi:pyroglutamyl-peptidase